MDRRVGLHLSKPETLAIAGATLMTAEALVSPRPSTAEAMQIAAQQPGIVTSFTPDNPFKNISPINRDDRFASVEQRETADNHPAVVDFTLKVIGKEGQDVQGNFYKVQGRGNPNEFYLYLATANQPYSGPDAEGTRYRRNTDVVAKFTYEGKDANGQDKWRRDELKQSTAVVKGKLEPENCTDKCLDAFIDITEVDENGNQIPGGEKDSFKIRDLTPFELCDRWGYWYDVPSQVPTTTPEPTPAPTFTPTPRPTQPPVTPPRQLPVTGN